MQNIFVGNLATNTSELTLQTLFEAFGQVLSVKVVNDRDTAASRGFAFIEMSSDAEAQAAIAALNGTVIDGRRLNVNEARPKDVNSSNVQQQMRRHRDHRY
jgi:RNA recognition motif-containing protein